MVDKENLWVQCIAWCISLMECADFNCWKKGSGFHCLFDVLVLSSCQRLNPSHQRHNLVNRWEGHSLSSSCTTSRPKLAVVGRWARGLFCSL
jgi:hypothetical protein